ncbi:SpaA isopeptide-forming pilin-related protein [Bacillus sp. FJAT-28004]|uniref:SpaA isopeptide-forming pilin-related protein n=1 Tax=Bacillus sp. FJAT-28004 TaxID=1679165 RepID=UPI0006B685EB|nr:SpaA isopeptide-forming pilin-related protein [Bacillus sp. FJAT-28004]
MRYFKKKLCLSLALLLIFTLSISSLAMAEGESNQSTDTAALVDENSCPQYSSDRKDVIATHSNIVVNNDGTATATFQTTKDCVRVSFSAYEGPADWAPGSGDTTIPYNLQTYFEGGQSIVYPKAGTHTVTINIPKCLPYQIDIYSGDLIKKLGPGAHGDKILAWNLKLSNSCTGNITINKHLNHVEGAPHAGITFELWKNGLLIKSGVTNSDGILQFNELPIGTYTLKELTLDGFTTDLVASQQIVVTTDNLVQKQVINTPKLKLESACSAEPDKTRIWKVSNESNIEVPFSWEIPNSNQTGNGVIPGKDSVNLTTNTELVNPTDPQAIPNTLKIHWGSEKELSLVNEGETCSTPTPTPSSTPENTPTPTPSSTPENTPTPTPSSTPVNTPTASPTPSPTPVNTPTVTTTVTTSPTSSPEATPIIEIDDEDPPIGGIGEGEEGEPPIVPVVDVDEDQVPLDTLPKTGEGSPIPYYLIGAFALSAGFLTLRKQKQRK